MTSRPFRFIDFQVQAAEIVERARSDAEEILRQARADADLLREKARAEGMAQGREIAAREERARLAAEFDRGTALVVRLVREVDARRDRLVEEAERDLVRLAVAIAGKIVKGEVKSKRGVAEENLRAAAALAAHRQGLVARVHPDDLRLIEHPRMGPLLLQADPAIERGGCVVDLAPGEVDLQISTQLEQIERGLLE